MPGSVRTKRCWRGAFEEDGPKRAGADKRGGAHVRLG
jgi:hypothetical protein